MAMDARKQRILEAIVALYANGGEPVGSGLLANYFSFKNRAAWRKRDCQPNIRTPAQSDTCVKERAGKSFLSSSMTK